MDIDSCSHPTQQAGACVPMARLGSLPYQYRTTGRRQSSAYLSPSANRKGPKQQAWLSIKLRHLGNPVRRKHIIVPQMLVSTTNFLGTVFQIGIGHWPIKSENGLFLLNGPARMAYQSSEIRLKWPIIFVVFPRQLVLVGVLEHANLTTRKLCDRELRFQAFLLVIETYLNQWNEWLRWYKKLLSSLHTK